MKQFYAALALAVFLLMGTASKAFVDVISAVPWPAAPNSCDVVYVPADFSLGCGNYAYAGATVTTSGSLVRIEFKYTIGPICLPVIVPDSRQEPIGMLSAGTHTIRVVASVNGAPVDSLAGITMVVTNCCSATAGYTFGGSNDSICLGDTLLLTNTASGYSSVTWYINGTIASTDTNLLYPTTTSGSFNVAMVVAGTACSDSLAGSFYVAPAPAFNLGSDTTLCVGDSMLLSVTGFGSVAWSTGQNGPTLWVSQPGTYGATATTALGCVAMDSISVGFITCGTGLEEEERTVRAYPNPANEVVRLTSSSVWILPLEVYNLQGQLMQRYNTHFAKQFDLPTAHLPQGMYIVRWNTQVGTGSTRIVVRH